MADHYRVLWRVEMARKRAASKMRTKPNLLWPGRAVRFVREVDMLKLWLLLSELPVVFGSSGNVAPRILGHIDETSSFATMIAFV
jgi:hypothetical protein